MSNDDLKLSKSNRSSHETIMVVFEITFTFDLITSTSELSEARCWQGLFVNPVIVRGFPIASRRETTKGLEIPLDILATLLQAFRVTWYDGIPCLKNFSMVAVPTVFEAGMLLWHLISNDDNNKRISYNDPRISVMVDTRVKGVGVAELEGAQHILGWCPKVKNLTDRTAPYTINHCGLRKTYSGCVLEKVSITAGKFITVGLTAAVGKRDKTVICRARDDYIRKLMYIEGQFILFFDVNDRRAWLVDGASALLHLVRSSIRNLKEHKEFGKLCLFEWESLCEPTEQCSGNTAAISVMVNEENMQQRLVKRSIEKWQEESTDASGFLTTTVKSKVTFVQFSDKIEQIYHILEEIIDCQAAAATDDGIGLKMRASPRRQLEGFDFTDIAEDRDPLYPRVHTLHEYEKGWVDFVRSIHTITLFGSGFGELIQPANPRSLCSPWVNVPKGRDYLAVSTSTMKQLFRRGDTNVIPWRIADDIYWHTPGKTFESCQCKETHADKHCERVQVFLPSGFRTLWGRRFKSPAYLEDDGALIFGHSLAFPLRWGDHGDPSRAAIHQDRLEPEVIDQDRDSGLGSSLAVSSTEQATSTTVGESSTRNPVFEGTVQPLQEAGKNGTPKLMLQSFNQLIRRAGRGVRRGILGSAS